LLPPAAVDLVFLALLLLLPLPLLQLQQRPPPGLGSYAPRKILTWFRSVLLSLLAHNST
jgi:hypothetical protein